MPSDLLGDCRRVPVGMARSGSMQGPRGCLSDEEQRTYRRLRSVRSVPRLREKEAEQSQPGSAESLKGARDLCRSLDLMKKQCVVGSTQLQNRCLLRQRIVQLPVA